MNVEHEVVSMMGKRGAFSTKSFLFDLYTCKDCNHSDLYVISPKDKAHPASEAKKSPTADGFCVKCRKKVEMVDVHEEVLKNKRKALVGRCPTCKTKVVRILPKARS